MTWLYKLAFRYGGLGIAAALSMIMFFILLAFTIAYAAARCATSGGRKCLAVPRVL